MDWTRVKHTATVKLKQLTCVQYLKHSLLLVSLSTLLHPRYSLRLMMMMTVMSEVLFQA